jgi:hypothetical protein
MYRKLHIGKCAAELILQTDRGRWKIKFNEKNIGAKDAKEENRFFRLYEDNLCAARHSDSL